MQPTSTAQFDTADSDQIPGFEHVRDGLFCYALPQPGTLPHYAFSYVLLDDAGAVHLIDAGWDSDGNWERLITVLGTLDREASDIASVTVTHLHPDHLGMAERIRAASGATVAIHELEQDGIRELSTPAPEPELRERLAAWGVPAEHERELLEAFRRRSAWKPFTADRLLMDGERLDVPGHDIRALHTPGHTTGHLAFVDEAKGVIFLGDLLLPNQFPGIGLGGTPVGNPIDHYLASLNAVAAFDDFEALPGHGYRFRGIAERCAETAAHHENRTREVSAALHPDVSVWELASTLTWTAGWRSLEGLALLSALSQTDLHRDRAERLA